MNNEERKLMLKMGERLGIIEKELKGLKEKPPAVDKIKVDNKDKVDIPRIEKFFGITENTANVQLSFSFKDGVTATDEQMKAIKSATDILRKQVQELGEYLDLGEFSIEYIDKTIKK